MLLIVDYIFDWARDVYRPFILRELRILSTPDTDDIISLLTDTDILSKREPISPWIPPSQARPSSEMPTLEENVPFEDFPPLLRTLDSKEGFIRHASNIQLETLPGLYSDVIEVSRKHWLEF